ncbi:hypothetical protein Tco_0191675, partial [Tanacetum coccineum]
MAASAITISSDSSDESLGSPPSWVILFGDIPNVIPSTYVVALKTSTIAPVISSTAPMVEMTLVTSPTGFHFTILMHRFFSEAPDSSDGPPSQDPYGYSKNHKRTVKTRQIRTREWKRVYKSQENAIK